MILDTLENLSAYRGISKNLDRALLWLQDTDLEALCPGTYPISREDVFCRVIEARLDPGYAVEAEAHQRYLDIHVALESGERFAFLNREEAGAWSEYAAESDTQTAPLSQKRNIVVLYPGMFAVCFPQDAHCPLLTAEEPKTIRKLIVKVLWK